MNTFPPGLDLTVAELCLSPQQLALAIRYGAQDESGQFEQREIYQAMQQLLGERELRWVRVPFVLEGISFQLSVNRVYEKDGDIYRLDVIDEQALQHRLSKEGGKKVIVPTETNETVLNLARYLVYLKTGQVAPKLWVMHHVVSPMQEVLEQYRAEVKPWDFLQAERVIKTKILALRDALNLPDNHLPACTDVEKRVSNGVAYNCAMQCPSRGVCFQKRTEFARLLEHARTIGVIDDREKSFHEEQEEVFVSDGEDPAGIV